MRVPNLVLIVFLLVMPVWSDESPTPEQDWYELFRSLQMIGSGLNQTDEPLLAIEQNLIARENSLVGTEQRLNETELTLQKRERELQRRESALNERESTYSDLQSNIESISADYGEAVKRGRRRFWLGVGGGFAFGFTLALVAQ